MYLWRYSIYFFPTRGCYNALVQLPPCSYLIIKNPSVIDSHENYFYITSQLLLYSQEHLRQSFRRKSLRTENVASGKPLLISFNFLFNFFFFHNWITSLFTFFLLASSWLLLFIFCSLLARSNEKENTVSDLISALQWCILPTNISIFVFLLETINCSDYG